MTRHLKDNLRVNHAGEMGAVAIYAGQLRVLGDNPAAATIRHMRDQEQQHLAAFNALLPEHQVRPSALQPLWRAGGFMLGMVSALLGEKAAHACTEAVETVIDAHYQQQIDAYADSHPDLVATYRRFQAEELEHKQTAIDNGAHQAVAYPFLSAVIGGITRAAIGVSKKL